MTYSALPPSGCQSGKAVTLRSSGMASHGCTVIFDCEACAYAVATQSAMDMTGGASNPMTLNHEAGKAPKKIVSLFVFVVLISFLCKLTYNNTMMMSNKGVSVHK